MVFDEVKRNALVQLIESQSDDAVVSLEDFFDGCADWSIAANCLSHPGVKRFYEFLREVRARDGVQDVLVAIVDVDEEWPYSDRVYVLSCYSYEVIADWFAWLQPDEVTKGWADKAPPYAPTLEPGMQVCSVWWD